MLLSVSVILLLKRRDRITARFTLAIPGDSAIIASDRSGWASIETVVRPATGKGANMSDTSSAVRVVRRSRFARYYQRGEDVCFFHSLTMDVLFGCDRLLEFFLSFPAADEEPETVQPTDDPEDDTIEAIDLFCQKGLLVENGERDEKLPERVYRQGREPASRPTLPDVPFCRRRAATWTASTASSAGSSMHRRA